MFTSLSPRNLSLDGRPSILSQDSAGNGYFYKGNTAEYQMKSKTTGTRNKSSFHLTQKIVQAAKQ
jgi:hypothetical protein